MLLRRLGGLERCEKVLRTSHGMQGAIAKHPYPGYFGNSAGPTAYFLAYGSGEPPADDRSTYP